MKAVHTRRPHKSPCSKVLACAHNLVASIRDQPLKTFEFTNKGTVASLGKGEAIGIAFGTRNYKGNVAAMLKKAIDMRYLYIIGGIPLVVRKGLLVIIYKRGDRHAALQCTSEWTLDTG